MIDKTEMFDFQDVALRLHMEYIKALELACEQHILAFKKLEAALDAEKEYTSQLQYEMTQLEDEMQEAEDKLYDIKNIIKRETSGDYL